MEIVEKQNDIICIQTEIINELFGLLTQHISAKELEKLAVLDKIKNVVDLREEL